MRTGILLLLLLMLSLPAAPAVADGIKTAGDVLQAAVPGFAFTTTALKHDKKGAVQLLKSYALSIGATYLLKYSVQEERPNGGNYSFPSGHTSNAFTSAEFLRVRYGWKWGIPFYAIGAFVAYSRVESDEHFPHDVIVGAAIGIISSHIFTHPFHGWNMSFNAEHAGFSAGFTHEL